MMNALKRCWWLILLALVAVYPLIGKLSPYKSGLLIFAGIYIILAVGLDLLMGYTGQISVGHAAFFAVGAYTSGILTAKYGFSPAAAMGVGAVFSASLAFLTGRPVLALKEYYLAMATLAFNEIVITLIIGFEGITGGASGLRDIPPFSLFGFSLINHLHYYYFVWSVVALVIASSIAVVRSPFGRALIAVHSDEAAARSFGVDCAKYKTRAYMLAAVYASIAGSLFAHYMGFIAPDDFGILTSINLLVMLFLGGIGTIFGPALGALFLKLLPEVTYQLQDYELLINGLILIVVLVFFPKGLFGIFTALRNKIMPGMGR